MLVVRDVPASSRSTSNCSPPTAVTAATSTSRSRGTGVLLQLHHLEVEHHHGRLAGHDLPLGNGVLVWFEVADFDAAVAQVRAIGAPVVRDVHVNPNAQQQELWLRDPDGYLVVLAGPSEYRPRANNGGSLFPGYLPAAATSKSGQTSEPGSRPLTGVAASGSDCGAGDCTVRSFDDADGPALRRRISTPRLMSKR